MANTIYAPGDPGLPAHYFHPEAKEYYKTKAGTHALRIYKNIIKEV